jgi:hypothetical protein
LRIDWSVRFMAGILTIRRKSPPWTQPADAGKRQPTWATPKKAEVFRDR